MASTYSTNLAIELIGTGDQAGSWGNTTNTNLGTLIEQAISGYVTQAVSTGTDTTITIPNGATGVARNMYIELTGTGGTNTNLIVPANKKLYFIFNNTTGAVTVKVSGQTGVSVPQGKKVVLTSNGTDIVNGLNYIADFGSNSATITQLTATSATITNLTLTSLVISNLSIASANVTTLTSASATITNLLATSLTVSGNTFLATSSGNVGVGVTPSAWGTTNLKALQVGTSAFWNQTNTDNLYLSSNNYYDGTNYKYIISDFAAEYSMTNGRHIWSTAASGTAGNNVTFTEVMRITAGGDVGIGTSSPATKLDVNGITQSRGNLYGGTSNTTANVLAYANVANGGAGFSQFLFANTSTETRGYLTYTHASDALLIGTAGTTKATLDTSGNLGLGVTPSAWNSGAKAFDIANGAVYAFSSSNNIALASNAFYNTSNNWIYKQSSQATLYAGEAGQHRFFTAASGTAGNAITFTQAMTLSSTVDRGTLDVNGNTQALLSFSHGGSRKSYIYQVTNDMLIWNESNGYLAFGTNGTERARITSGGDLCVQATSAVFNSTNRGNITIGGSASSLLFLGTGTTTGTYIYHDQSNSNVEFWNNANGAIIFGTNNTARARITSGGDLLVGTTTGSYNRIVKDLSGNYALQVTNTSASSPYCVEFNMSGVTGGAGSAFLVCYDNANRLVIYGSGDVKNVNNSYGSLSDIKLKQDIVDAASQWDDIKNLRVRKYRFKENPTAALQIGLIAQELEQVSPGLVDEHPDRDGEGNDLGTTTKSVKYSVLYMKSIKALQEAMARIEQLETKVAELEAK